jgi:hypothetical protein
MKTMNMNIANIADGALVEQADIEIKKVIENILDPNTGTKMVRKVIIELDFKADERRDVSEVKFTVKSKLAPQTPIVTRVAFDRDRNGEIVTEELRKNALKGQMYIDDDGEIVEPMMGANIDMEKASRVVNNLVRKIVNIK